MKKMYLTVAVLSVLVSSAMATTTYFDGTSCQDYSYQEVGALLRGDGGCTVVYASVNASPDVCGRTAAVIFPVSGNTTDTVNYDFIYMDYVDGRQHVGATQDHIDCYLNVIDSAGTSHASQILSSSNGAGTFQWGGMGFGTLPGMGNNITGTRQQHFVCHIPSSYYTVGSTCVPEFQSYIADYRIDASSW